MMYEARRRKRKKGCATWTLCKGSVNLIVRSQRLDSWSDIILDISLIVFLHEICSKISGFWAKQISFHIIGEPIQSIETWGE